MAASTGPQRRTERLLNLVVYLLGAERGVTRADLRHGIEDYRGSPSDEAFERMFERDKQDLRDLGIPLITTAGSSGFGDDISYRIDRSGYQLPEVEFTTAERAVLVVAGRAWEQAALGSAAAGALRKLGVASDLVPLPPVMTSVGTSEASFDAIYSAVLERSAITFSYLAGGATEPAVRQLQPWVVVSRNGRWYVAGHDTARDDLRVFRLSRIAGDVKRIGEPGAFTVPPGALERSAALDLVQPEGESLQARIRVRGGHGHGLRRRAASVESGQSEWDVLVINDSDIYRLAAELSGYAADVVVESPPELRDAVKRSLQGVHQVHA